MQKVCVDRLDDNTTRRLTNLMAAGAYPQGLEYNVAGGVMHNNRPRILATNVDRNAVYDAVLQAANKKQSAGPKMCDWCEQPATWIQSYQMDYADGREQTFRSFACDQHKQEYFDQMTNQAALQDNDPSPWVDPNHRVYDLVTEHYWPTPGQLFQTKTAKARLCDWCDQYAQWHQDYDLRGRPMGDNYACDSHKQQYFDEITHAATEPGTEFSNVVTEHFWPTPGQLFQTSLR